MKFLALAKLKEIPPLPPEQFMELVVKEWQMALQFFKEGKVEMVYALAGLKGAMAIHVAESGAELHAKLSSLPLYVWLEIEIYPLMEAEEALTFSKKRLDAIKAKQ